MCANDVAIKVWEDKKKKNKRRGRPGKRSERAQGETPSSGTRLPLQSVHSSLSQQTGRNSGSSSPLFAPSDTVPETQLGKPVEGPSNEAARSDSIPASPLKPDNIAAESRDSSLASSDYEGILPFSPGLADTYAEPPKTRNSPPPEDEDFQIFVNIENSESGDGYNRQPLKHESGVNKAVEIAESPPAELSPPRYRGETGGQQPADLFDFPSGNSGIQFGSIFFLSRLLICSSICSC